MMASDIVDGGGGGRPPLDAVLQAIHALYHHPDPATKEKANSWLHQLQSSVFAWTVADELLQRKVDMESCYFGAQTLRTKIQFSFNELPIEAHAPLKDSLMQHISNTDGNTNPIITTQLSLAIADLALQLSSWKDSLPELITKFGENQSYIPVLLEILTVLPEEIHSRSLRLGENRRDEVLLELRSNASIILKLLQSCIGMFSADTKICTRILRCLSSWLTVDALPMTELSESGLLLTIFQPLMERSTAPMIHEAAADCVCSSLLVLDNVAKHPALAQTLYQGVLALKDAYQYAVGDEDADKVMNYCRIFTELAESVLEQMIAAPGKGFGDLRILDLLLMCIGHPDYEVSEITFNFWYRMSEMLYKRNDDQLDTVFKPYIELLITTLCRHCRMEPDHEGIPDEGDDFFEYRARVSDLVKEVLFIIGSSMCFRQMFSNIQAQGENATWDVVEASLFIMTAVAKSILPEEESVVPQVMECILRIPDTVHIAVRYSSIQLIGELSEWINKHPHTLDPVLNFLLAGLQNKPVSSVSAVALQQVCTNCQERMVAHFSSLVQIVKAVDTFSIRNDATLALLRGVAVILSRMPAEGVTEGLKQLCAVQVAPLEQLIKDSPATNGSAVPDPVIWLDRLATIFRNMTFKVIDGQPHPCQPAVTEVWPILSEVCTRYQNDLRVVERCCRCIRFAIRCVGKQSAHLLRPLVEQIVHLYQAHQHSCFLYLGSILVDEYGTEEGCVTGLLDMLQAFAQPTFRVLEEENGMRNHPDTVDDFFRLCLRCVQRCPLPFLQCPVLRPVLQCAISACSLDHREANATVMKFLHDIIKCGRCNQQADDYLARYGHIQTLVSEHGQSLISSLIHATLFCLPSYMVADISDVIYQLLQFDKTSFYQWLEVSLKALPTQTPGGCVTITERQLRDFHDIVLGAESEKFIKIALQNLARLYR